MKSLPLPFAMLLFSVQLVSAQYNTDNLSLESSPTEIQKFTFQNLRLYPVKANEVFMQAHAGVGHFSDLENAIEQNKIKITELNDEQVNTLYVENVSNDSVFMMAGEVVEGGRQDRVLAQDLILKPGQKVDIAAFCVEQGRWAYGDTAAFNHYYNLSSNELRKVIVQDKDQRKVWSKVSEITSMNDADSETDAYTELQRSEAYQEALSPYLQKFNGLFDKQNAVIGVVAVTGDKVIGCDLFATHALFTNAYNSLLNAYATEAITNGTSVVITDQAVHDYVNKFLADESKQETELHKSGNIYKFNNKKVHITVF